MVLLTLPLWFGCERYSAPLKAEDSLYPPFPFIDLFPPSINAKIFYE